MTLLQGRSLGELSEGLVAVFGAWAPLVMLAGIVVAGLLFQYGGRLTDLVWTWRVKRSMRRRT